MSSPIIADLLVNLPPRHREALRWFEEHTGEEVPWPQPLPDGTLLVTKAKGIYKPNWSEYALSVRRSLAGIYPDKPIQTLSDGSWCFEYFQENLDSEKRDDEFTNRGLLKCKEDVVPIGVLDQTRARPNQRYLVVGLAFVDDYEQGYFTLQGMGASLVRDSSRPIPSAPTLTSPQVRADLVASAFDPENIEDQRRNVVGIIAQRQGQPGFRRLILNAYGQRCAITGYDAPESLEAAHIIPYRGPVTHHPSNGILLRSDLHSLFDLGLVAVDTDSRAPLILVSPKIRGSKYEPLHGSELRLPERNELRPSIEALRQHRMAAAF